MGEKSGRDVVCHRMYATCTECLAKEALEGFGYLKMAGKEYAESKEGRVLGKLCLRQPFGSALKMRISYRCSEN